MEQMAVHPDIVEKVIAESQARGGKFPVPSKGGSQISSPFRSNLSESSELILGIA